MDEIEEKYRRMTHMVITAAESALADILRQQGSDTSELIREYLKQRDDLDVASEDDPIATIYWQELWNFAAKLEPDEFKKDLFGTVKEKCAFFEIQKARNAAAHGNRTFQPYYWYSVAALVSSPEFQALKLTSVTEALWNAESGTIADIPNFDAISNYQLSTPNNLDAIEYTDAGFIGRQQERQDIENSLLKSRFDSIAIKGPGGVGKTAVVSRVLQELSLKDEFDFIFAFSFKEDWLTKSGVKKRKTLAVDDFFEHLAIFFQTEFSVGDVSPTDIIMEHKSLRGCVFLDNVETLLVQEKASFDGIT
jgi:ATP-dependent Clp protease ATP-binding subunit ClpA